MTTNKDFMDVLRVIKETRDAQLRRTWQDISEAGIKNVSAFPDPKAPPRKPDGSTPTAAPAAATVQNPMKIQPVTPPDPNDPNSTTPTGSTPATVTPATVTPATVTPVNHTPISPATPLAANKPSPVSGPSNFVVTAADWVRNKLGGGNAAPAAPAAAPAAASSTYSGLRNSSRNNGAASAAPAQGGPTPTGQGPGQYNPNNTATVAASKAAGFKPFAPTGQNVDTVAAMNYTGTGDKPATSAPVATPTDGAKAPNPAFNFNSVKGGIVSQDELTKWRNSTGNQNGTLGQYMNARDGKTAIKGGANDISPFANAPKPVARPKNLNKEETEVKDSNMDNTLINAFLKLQETTTDNPFRTVKEASEHKMHHKEKHDKEASVLVTRKDDPHTKTGGGVVRIKKSDYDPAIHKLAEDNLDETASRVSTYPSKIAKIPKPTFSNNPDPKSVAPVEPTERAEYLKNKFNTFTKYNTKTEEVEAEEVEEGVIKTIKRGLQGWPSTGPLTGNEGKPKDVVKRAKELDIDTAKSYINNPQNKEPVAHSPAALQKKVLLKRIAKEEVEELDEISKEELRKMADAAMASGKVHKVETGLTSGISGREFKNAAQNGGKVKTHAPVKTDYKGPSATFKGTYAGTKHVKEEDESLFSEEEIAYINSILEDGETPVKRGRGRPKGSYGKSYKRNDVGSAEAEADDVGPARVAAQVRTTRSHFNDKKQEVVKLLHPETKKHHEVPVKHVNDFNRDYATAERPAEKEKVESDFMKKHMS